MSFSDEELLVFNIEALELLDCAEKCLLQLDKGESLHNHYNSIFRAFHSIKGAAGMMDMIALQSHMHQLESIFTQQQGQEFLSKEFTDLFLRGVDATKAILRGQKINFDYQVIANSPLLTKPSSPENIATVTQLGTKPAIGKILVVDDEPEIVDLLTKILRLQNITAKGVARSEEVMGALATFKPDALFTDISMPGDNGIDILKALNKSHPDIPVVFISGYVNKDILLQAIELGVFGVIEKPFDIVKVSACAITAIEKHRLTKMLNSSINLLMYQFADLSDFLKSQGRDDIHKIISDEISALLEQRRIFRQRLKKDVG